MNTPLTPLDIRSDLTIAMELLRYLKMLKYDDRKTWTVADAMAFGKLERAAKYLQSQVK